MQLAMWWCPWCAAVSCKRPKWCGFWNVYRQATRASQSKAECMSQSVLAENMHPVRQEAMHVDATSSVGHIHQTTDMAQCDNHAASLDVGLIFTYLGGTRVSPLGRVTTCGYVHNGNTSVVHRSFGNCPTVMPSGTVQSRRKPRDALACSACYLEKGWLGKDPVI
jgi:hypothetical protein